MPSIVIVVVDSVDVLTLAVNSGTPVSALPESSNVIIGVQRGSVVVVVGKSGVHSGIGSGTGVGASVGISVVGGSGTGVGASVTGGSVTVVVVVVVGQPGLELCTHVQATCFAVEHSMQFVSTNSCCSTQVCKFALALLFANVMSPERRFLANDLFLEE